MTLDELKGACRAKWVDLGVVRGYDIKKADRARTNALFAVQEEAAEVDPNDQAAIDELATRLEAI